MTEFPKNYNAEESEALWYAHWEREGAFRPEANPGGAPYSIVIPPPNVTGSLHMGHALNATLQDSLARYHRMCGRRVLWLPGTDHAGIATQNVVERELAREGTDRHSLGRRRFVERVWRWREEYGGRIMHQLKKLGSSCDWSRERFTLDEGLSRAVREVFVRLYESGLIYRAERLINWCPRCRTALSDLEVEHEDVQGALTHIRYPLADGSGHVTVATTRPETMLGDTGVAVNPEDGRYRGVIGKALVLPLAGRAIPIVADQAVDPAFGTGAVKVTPAHDFNDEAMARRQQPPLPSLTVIGPDGRMTAEAGERFAGLDRYECRKLVVEELKALGLLDKVEAHAHAVGHCYRCRTVIEPHAAPQWYVKIQPLAEEAIYAVREGRIRIVPEGWENSYFAWMENIQDWCVTRQIWWGHRIPVWYCLDCGDTIVSRTTPVGCPACRSDRIEQDPDVLDTWFSSALWPFSTLGWPDDTRDLRDFYPTSVLVTAHDILFFWVARMIMMGLRFMDGEVPFRDVYIHALVRDQEGQKMSKSKGNVVDPLVIIDKFGADAFRFTLAAFAAQGRDVRFSEDRVEGYRHFINKLWNATRFILMNLPEGRTYPSAAAMEAALRGIVAEGRATPAQRYILLRLSRATQAVRASMEGYHFNEAAGAIYHFTWLEFCDWYIEMSKTEMTDDTRLTLLYVLERILRMLHPFMPFLTEDVWHRLPIEREGPTISLAAFPEAAFQDISAGDAELVIEAVSGIRNIRGELNIPPKDVLDLHVRTFGEEARAALDLNRRYIEDLARVKVVAVGPDAARPESAHTFVRDRFEAFVLRGTLDVGGELARLAKEREKIEESLEFVGRKLANADFISRAPAGVVAKEEKRRAELAELRAKVIAEMHRLGARPQGG